LGKIPLPLPSLPEQQRIAEILFTIDKKLEVEKNEKAKLERIKQGLMDLLLTGKIRVKVD
jgi:type I restriction enzyme S subunit